MQQNSVARVIIADDHPIIREGLTTRFASVPGLKVAGETASFAGLLEILPTTQADVVVLDLQRMGDSPVKVAQRLCRDFPSVGVVIYSGATELVPELVKIGVLGCVSKTDPVAELIKAIHFVAAGQRYMSQTIQAFLDKISNLGKITEREHTICQMVVGGYETPEIGEWLGIGTKTAQNTIGNLFAKTGTTNRVQLAEWYRQTFGLE